MADTRENCSLLFLSNDLEWINAFSKGVERFYALTDRRISRIAELNNALEEEIPTLIIVGISSEINVEAVRAVLTEGNFNVPIMVIDPSPTNLDLYIKQGAEYSCIRKDLLSALKHVQQVMRLRQIQEDALLIQKNSESLKGRYSKIFDELPDPIAYVQDGLFIDVNPAFINVFGLSSRQALDETTLMTFVPNKTERALKTFLKKAVGKDVVPAEKFEFQKINGEPLEVLLSVGHITVDEETALQLLFRTASASGSGSSLDATTRLPSKEVLCSTISQSQEKAEAGSILGYWVYLLIENYREIWQRDGHKSAEILIKSVAETTQKLLPPSTEICRFTDDALAMWLTGDKEAVIQRVQTLIARLDELVPENIGRLVTPLTFAGMYEIRQDISFEELSSKGFRAARALVGSQNGERVAEPLSGNMTRKDEKRVNQLKEILNEKLVKLMYQPITSLEADGVARYAEILKLTPKEEEGEYVEPEQLWQVAERYGIAREFDYLKISMLTADLLSYSGDQKALNFFVALSINTLNDEEFPKWLETQLKSTGVSPSQVTFEFSFDTYNNCFSGSMRLVERLRPLGAKFALTEIARFDDEIKDMLKRLKPEVIKLDMREIDTFEDEEEERFMTTIKKFAEEHNIMLIVNHMESPAQLSRVWRYDLQLLQGDGIVPASEKLNFNFSEPLF